MTNEKADEIMRHFDVVAETLRSEIRSLAEGNGMLVEGQKRLEVGQQVLTDRVTGLETGQQALVGSVKRLETGQQVLMERVKGLDAGLQNLTVGLLGLGDELKVFRSEVASEFSELRSVF